MNHDKTSHYMSLIPAKVVIAYAALASLWIFFSDRCLEMLVHDPHLMSRLATMKGWVFVLVTSAMLYLLIYRFVTHLKVKDRQFRESERRFREMMERVHLIALMLDREGRITFCNDYFLGLTGWKREELHGRDWIDTFIREEDREELRALFREGIASSRSACHHEGSILTRNGAVLLIVWDHTLLYTTDGEVAGIACLGMDVTEHRNIEAQLRQSQKMESIGTLAGGIAHDFNNILTVIINSCEMLRSRSIAEERAGLLLDQIDNAARRAAKLTRSLLAFSRKQVIDPKPVDLNRIVTEMLDFVGRIIGEDIMLRTALAEGQLPVLADRSQIEQVIMNLVGNARDAMPEGGTLTISTASGWVEEYRLPDGSTATGRHAILTVNDTGSGIPDDIRDRIFEPFFTTKELGKGTGLGLSMAYGIVRQHNGWIDVESQQGLGSSFSMYLLQQRELSPDAYEAGIQAHPPGATILLVEDDELVLETNRAILETMGFRVIGAHDAAEAIRLFEKDPLAIDVAMLDIVMPLMSGNQLYDLLKQIKPDLRVLFTSGYTADRLERNSLPENCPFIAKPYTPRELMNILQKLLEK